jgi:hypothetical protein
MLQLVEMWPWPDVFAPPLASAILGPLFSKGNDSGPMPWCNRQGCSLRPYPGQSEVGEWGCDVMPVAAPAVSSIDRRRRGADVVLVCTL